MRNPRALIIREGTTMQIRESFDALFTCAIVSVTTATSHASTITWGSPQNISGDTDVDTTGSLVGAFNTGAAGVANTTINGVPFLGLALSGNSVTSGNFNFSIASAF